MPKLRRIPCYELEPGEVDDGKLPILHTISPDDAQELAAFLMSGLPASCGEHVRMKMALALAHASVIHIT